MSNYKQLQKEWLKANTPTQIPERQFPTRYTYVTNLGQIVITDWPRDSRNPPKSRKANSRRHKL